MAKFYTGDALRAKIREVMEGNNPRISVAFLGVNWAKELFGGAAPKNLKILCDIAMGVTPRPALEAAGAPDNKNLRHVPSVEMHGKVYLSDAGAVVCSANATAKALSSGDRRIEDGIWVDSDSDAYKRVKSTIKSRFKNAHMIGQNELDAAPLNMPSLGGRKTPSDGLTIVDWLRRDPEIFRGIRFVCSGESVRKEVREAADREMEKEYPESAERTAWRRGYFSNWGTEERDWPALFFSVYVGRSGRVTLSKNCHVRFVTTPEDEVFVSSLRDWRACGPAFGDLPRLASRKQCEKELRQLIHGRRESLINKILSGSQFSEWLTRTSALAPNP